MQSSDPSHEEFWKYLYEQEEPEAVKEWLKALSDPEQWYQTQ